jgi:hypothetical protein
MCEEKKTSMEHAPPKCIFPEKKDLPKGFNFRKNLISVPSCDEHNSRKSKDDEYLMFVLATSLGGNEHKFEHFKNKVMRAVQRRPHVFQSFMQNQQPVLLVDEQGKRQTSVSYKIDEDRIDNMFKHIAHGLFFHHTGQKWAGNYWVFCPDFMVLEGDDPARANQVIQKIGDEMNNQFTNEGKNGHNPDVFTYSLVSDKQNRHALSMSVYRDFKAYVLVGDF